MGVALRKRNTGFALVLLAALAACSPLRVLGPGRALVSVGGTKIMVAAPEGFCVDPDSLRTLGDGVFLLLTDCSRGGAAFGDAPHVAMTVHLSRDALFFPQEDRLDTLDRLDKFLQSKDGRQVLSRDGIAADVSTKGSAIRNDALFIYVSDEGGARIPGASKNYWRGFTQVKGGLVSLTVYGFDSNPLSKAKGLAYANALVLALAQANPSSDKAR